MPDPGKLAANGDDAGRGLTARAPHAPGWTEWFSRVLPRWGLCCRPQTPPPEARPLDTFARCPGFNASRPFRRTERKVIMWAEKSEHRFFQTVALDQESLLECFFAEGLSLGKYTKSSLANRRSLLWNSGFPQVLPMPRG
jgi:hypothetical protein